MPPQGFLHLNGNKEMAKNPKATSPSSFNVYPTNSSRSIPKKNED